MIYKTKDVEKIFTDEVNKFLAKGYIYNCATMSGSQGEIAKVDLVSPDNKQLVRIVMEAEHDYHDYTDMLTITTKLYDAKTERVNVDSLSNWNTLWTHHGTEYNKIKFYTLDKHNKYSAFTNEESMAAIKAKRQSRYQNYRSINEVERKIFDDRYKNVMLSWLRRQPRCKCAKVTDINRIEKVIGTDGKVQFHVIAKNKWYTVK